MGKSLYIRRMSESLCSLTSSSNDCITIPVHGPRVTPDSIMALLKDHVANSTGTIFHIDVSPSVSYVNLTYDYVRVLWGKFFLQKLFLQKLFKEIAFQVVGIFFYK